MPKKKIFFSILILAGAVAGFFGFKYFKQLQPLPTTSHNSYFSEKQFYEDAYKNSKGSYNPTVQAILVNHHLLAASYIAESFNYVATNAPLTVLLISPNHFSTGKNSVLTSNAIWETPYGDLFPDSKFIENLVKNNLASLEEQPFEQEHGISGIVGFIKKSLPNALVVPLIFKDQVTLSQAQSLADKMQLKNVLVVGSFDFSHYLTDRAADFHDIENLNAVESFDFNSIYNLDIDSRPGLAFFLQLLKNQNAQKFNLLESSNSAKLSGQDILETTSYITGYFTSGVSATSSASTLLSLGNISASEKTLPFFERYSGKFALTFVERLFYGEDRTLAFLDSRQAEAESSLNRLGINLSPESSLIYQIGSLKAALINCEKNPLGARVAIDQGAEISVCQGAQKNSVEFYKNKPIVYASGNFLSENTIYKSEMSLAVGISVKANELTIFFFPIQAQAGNLKLLTGSESGKVLRETSLNSPLKLRTEIVSGELHITIDD